MTSEQKILDALSVGELPGAELQKLTGLWSIEFCPTLMRMEKSGKIASDWAAGAYPRRRVYWAARSKSAASDAEMT